MSFFQISILCAIAITSMAQFDFSSNPFGDPTDQFALFKMAFNKNYANLSDEQYHRDLFENELADIITHNSDFNSGLTPYTKGINQFSDWSPEQLKNLTSTDVPPQNFTSRAMKTHVATSSRSSCSSVDWRKSRVTSVKNQGDCGSCWAFAAAGAIEGQLSRNQLQSLSEQQMVDCAGGNNHGCDGGWPNSAFGYVEDNGLESESDYPYTGEKGDCKYDADKVQFFTDGYNTVEKGDEEALAETLCNNGPLAVAIHVSNDMFSYEKGVYKEEGCSKQVNHGVLLVGMGTENGNDYWIVKNSWGTGWGENGYIRMARNKDNQCAIASYASYPILN